MKAQITQLLAQALATVSPDSSPDLITLERPKQAAHGDYATNLALQLAKPLRRNPREIAQQLINALPVSGSVAKVELAGAGFINFFLTDAARNQAVLDILQQRANYGQHAAVPGEKVQVEFVSANPTGPLHVGHGRGAAFGASLVNLLRAAGYATESEYYVNDAGRQMDILALSTWLRYLALNGIEIPFPQNAYQGDYVIDMAREIHNTRGDLFVRDAAAVLAGVPPFAEDKEGHLDGLIANAKALLGPHHYAFIHQFALETQLTDCRDDLEEFGVRFSDWFSEKSLYDSGKVARAIEILDAQGTLYTKDGARWFKSTAFGDEKDRVVQRENGLFTYFASDIAYHLDKYERGYTTMINIWGADHHGYIPRVKGALSALGLDAERLKIALVQFAVLYRGEEMLPMSTRSGQFVTLRDLRQEVGNDAARFFYVMRKSDQHLDFDLELAKSQKNENPVYYIQYAHARTASVMEKWGGNPETLANADLGRLTEAHETALIKRLEEYPDLIAHAARELAPHLLAYYLKDLAADLHSYYNAQQFLVEDEALRHARLALVLATQQVIRNGLGILGISAPDSM